MLESYWFLADHLLSVQALTDSLGVVAKSYEYEDHGFPAVFSSSGISLGARSAKGNAFSFSGSNPHSSRTGGAKEYFYRSKH